MGKHSYFLAFFCVFGAAAHSNFDEPTRTVPAQISADIIKDAALICKNIFTLNSCAVVAATLPVYFSARVADKPIHGCFYNRKHHKNLHKCDPFFYGFARLGIIFPVFLSVAFALDANDYDLKQMSRFFLIGFPLVGWANDLIKKIKVDREFCLRPWHEEFSRRKRAFGGFPSGHMAVSAYTATLFGLEIGARAALPLGAYTFFVAATFVTCNRHYLSQTIAGTGLGVLFGFAAHGALEERRCKDRAITVTPDVTSQGNPALKVAWRF